VAIRKPLMPDVPRLLALKQQVRRSVLGEDTASSVAAFIAWKALLLISNAQPGSGEADRIQAGVRTSLRSSPGQLRPAVQSFVGALKRLSASDVTPSVRAEWMEDPRGEEEDIDAVLRSVKHLANQISRAPDEELWTLAPAIALNLRRVRHVVIGHVRVTTGSPLFSAIVNPFENLVTQLAELQYRALNS
jgi:hypothetical protein